MWYVDWVEMNSQCYYQKQKFMGSFNLAEILRTKVQTDMVTHQKENVTVSIGITKLTNTDTANSFIESADRTLYQAKTQGRNQVVAAITNILSFDEP